MSTNNNTIIKIGLVESVDDEYAAGRIRARVIGEDTYNNETPYAYPLLPYMMHIMPKVNEAVLLIYSNLGNASQRFYIGPIIHQPQFVNNDLADFAVSILKNFNHATLPSVERKSETHGAYPKKDEVAILGRKDTDLIFSDNDVRLRCGVHLTDKDDSLRTIFNEKTPTFIKLKQHDKKFSNNTNTTATIVSENINLISTVGTPEFSFKDTNESISDEEMAKIIETAHQLPYGDKLIEFLNLLLKAFNAHTHAYHNMPPVPDLTYNAVNNFTLQDILSKNVKIN